MTDTLSALVALEDPDRATQMAAYHKAPRRYLGIPNPVLNAMTTDWRRSLPLDRRLEEADRLWRSDMHEARIAAAKLLTQARIREDEAVWNLIRSWVPQFDAWAIADHACTAGAKRLAADPARLDQVEVWTTSSHLWTRRAALVMTLPWTRSNHPPASETAARDRILGWAASCVHDPEWFIQKAIAWWLRDLSKHDPARTRAFLAAHGATMKPFARREAARHLPD